MKWIWILVYYNQKDWDIKTRYFTSKEKAEKYAKEKEMPKSAVSYEIFHAEIN